MFFKKKKNEKRVNKDDMSLKDKWNEIVRYVIIGCITTAINWFVSIVFTEWIPLPGSVGSIIAWIVSTVFFAFWAYKFFVFRSRSMKKGVLYPEFVSFTAARLVTLGIEFLIMLVFVDIIGLDNDIAFRAVRVAEKAKDHTIMQFTIRERYIIKLFACIIVTIANYIFSKLIIFKKGQYSDGDDPQKPLSDIDE